MLNYRKIARLAAVSALALATLPLISVAPARAQAPTAEVFGEGMGRGRRSNSSRRSTSAAARRGTTATTTNGKKTTAKPKVDLKTILDSLSLTPAQKTSVNSLQAKADADGKAAYADRTLSSDQFIGKMDKIHENLMSDIRNVLTPEQQTKFDAQLSKEK